MKPQAAKKLPMWFQVEIWALDFGFFAVHHFKNGTNPIKGVLSVLPDTRQHIIIVIPPSFYLILTRTFHCSLAALALICFDTDSWMFLFGATPPEILHGREREREEAWLTPDTGWPVTCLPKPTTWMRPILMIHYPPWKIFLPHKHFTHPRAS